MAKTVLATSAVARLDPSGLASFRDAGFTVVERYELSGVRDPDVLVPALDGVWATLAGTELYSRAVLAAATSLRVIARCGVGVDSVDVAAATSYGIPVLTTSGTNVDAVADFTIALMLGCLRDLRRAVRAARSHDGQLVGIGDDLHASTVGIVGLGAIGQAVARRLAGFGCRIVAVDPAPVSDVVRELGIEVLDLDDVLRQSDVLTLHAPLKDETRGLLDAGRLARLRPGAVLINTSRGELVDEEALLAALETGCIVQAGLDVFCTEPLPPEHPLAQHDRTILAGHVASFTEGSVAATLQMVLEGMLQVLADEVPDACINPASWNHRTQASGG